MKVSCTLFRLRVVAIGFGGAECSCSVAKGSGRKVADIVSVSVVVGDAGGEMCARPLWVKSEDRVKACRLRTGSEVAAARSAVP